MMRSDEMSCVGNSTRRTLALWADRVIHISKRRCLHMASGDEGRGVVSNRRRTTSRSCPIWGSPSSPDACDLGSQIPDQELCCALTDQRNGAGQVIELHDHRHALGVHMLDHAQRPQQRRTLLHPRGPGAPHTCPPAAGSAYTACQINGRRVAGGALRGGPR